MKGNLAQALDVCILGINSSKAWLTSVACKQILTALKILNLMSQTTKYLSGYIYSSYK